MICQDVLSYYTRVTSSLTCPWNTLKFALSLSGDIPLWRRFMGVYLSYHRAACTRSFCTITSTSGHPDVRLSLPVMRAWSDEPHQLQCSLDTHIASEPSKRPLWPALVQALLLELNLSEERNIRTRQPVNEIIATRHLHQPPTTRLSKPYRSWIVRCRMLPRKCHSVV